MAFKFEKLIIWKLSLEYIDAIYEIAGALPRSEEFNLKSQIVRAATSVALNIAEGSTGQSDNEQARRLGIKSQAFRKKPVCHCEGRCSPGPKQSHLPHWGLLCSLRSLAMTGYQ